LSWGSGALGVLAWAAVATVLTARADTSVVFADDFDGREDPFGPGRWRLVDVNGGMAYMAEAAGHKNVLCVRRDNPDGETYATYELPRVGGTIQVQAQIRATSIVGGANPKAGQFHVQVRQGGEGIDRPKDEFAGDVDWVPPRQFIVADLSPDWQLTLRVGIQRGAGIVCIDNVVVTRIR
jgi:hypothetical protein